MSTGVTIHVVFADEGYLVGMFSDEHKDIAQKYARRTYRHGPGRIEEWIVDRLVPYVNQHSYGVFFNQDSSIKRIISSSVTRDRPDEGNLLPDWADINGPYCVIASSEDEAIEIATKMRSERLQE